VEIVGSKRYIALFSSNISVRFGVLEFSSFISQIKGNKHLKHREPNFSETFYEVNIKRWRWWGK
jgi:hypothetical protein